MELDQAVEMAERFLEKAVKVEKKRAALEEQAEEPLEFNRILKRISRVIMPVVTTVYGKFEQDNYGLTGLKYVIPTSESVLILSQKEEGSHEFYLWLNRARKERNKITDAMELAMEECDRLLTL